MVETATKPIDEALQELTTAAEDLTAFIRELVLARRSLLNRCNRAESHLAANALYMAEKHYDPLTVEWTEPELGDDDKCVADAVEQFMAKRQRGRG